MTAFIFNNFSLNILVIQVPICLFYLSINTEAKSIRNHQKHGHTQTLQWKNGTKRHIEFMPEGESPSYSEPADDNRFDESIMYDDMNDYRQAYHFTSTEHNNDMQSNHPLVNTPRVFNLFSPKESFSDNKNGFQDEENFQSKIGMGPRILYLPEQRAESRKFYINGPNNYDDRRRPDIQFEEFAPILQPDQVDELQQNNGHSLLESRPLYPNARKNGFNLVDGMFPSGENLEHGTQFNQGNGLLLESYPKSGNVMPENHEKLKEEAKNLEKVLHYAKKELREDILAPKEWNSSRVISTNLRFARNKNSELHNMKIRGDFPKRHSRFANRRSRNVAKKQNKFGIYEDSSSSVKTTHAGRKSKQAVFNTQITTFGEKALSEADTSDEVPSQNIPDDVTSQILQTYTYDNKVYAVTP